MKIFSPGTLCWLGKHTRRPWRYHRADRTGRDCIFCSKSKHIDLATAQRKIRLILNANKCFSEKNFCFVTQPWTPDGKIVYDYFGVLYHKCFFNQDRVRRLSNECWFEVNDVMRMTQELVFVCKSEFGSRWWVSWMSPSFMSNPRRRRCRCFIGFTQLRVKNW